MDKLELDLNRVIGKLHDVAIENAMKAANDWKLFKKDWASMMVNNGITKNGDESVFCGTGQTYSIIIKRKGLLGLDQCKTFIKEYMKWFAGDEKFNINKYNSKSVQNGKTNSRFFVFEYKVVQKKLQEKEKKLQKNSLEVQIQTPIVSESNSNINNHWLQNNPFGMK